MRIPIISTGIKPLTLNLKINNQAKRIDLGVPTGIAGYSGSSIEMFPNPANTMLYFRNLTGVASITIIDLQGRELISGTITDGQVDISNLENGIYSVRIEDASHTLIRKLIKQ
jgi:hypothetical protein